MRPLFLASVNNRLLFPLPFFIFFISSSYLCELSFWLTPRFSSSSSLSCFVISYHLGHLPSHSTESSLFLLSCGSPESVMVTASAALYVRYCFDPEKIIIRPKTSPVQICFPGNTPSAEDVKYTKSRTLYS